MDKKRSATDGHKLVEECDRSGLTRRQFCESNQIPMTTLDYWRWKKAQRSKAGLVEVAIELEERSPGFAVVLRNGRRIESAWTFQEPELSRLIRLLESV